MKHEERKVAYRRALAWHLIACVLIQSAWFGVSAMMPVLARKRFAAGDWETLLVTSAVSVLMVFSIFWNSLLQRMSIRKYLALHWFCTMGPLALGALATDFWTLWICYALAACGIAGWTPVAGDILKRLYPDHSRGRVFGIMSSAVYLGMAGTTYLIGKGLEFDDDFFRIYLPLSAASYGAGILLLRWLVGRFDADRSAAGLAAPFLSAPWYEPILHMREVLRADRVFYRYEAAFMTYGIGWMIGNALLPILATDRLKMTYEQFAASTQVPYMAFLLLCTYPLGWVNDRIGAARTSSLSFAGLTLYPIGLMLAHNLRDVTAITAWYGIVMAGVQIGWMIGPVSLAPSPEKVAQYSSIHATLVGLRGLVAQGLGMLIYRLTGSFVWPLAVAAIAYLWAAWQMWGLHRRIEERALRKLNAAGRHDGMTRASVELSSDVELVALTTNEATR